MKRQKRKVKSGQRQNTGPGGTAAAAGNEAGGKKSRRDFMVTLGNAGLVVAAAGGAGWFFVDEVCAATQEGDLTRIGNGIPAVVQIHDPECPRCRALQKEVRAAMSNFGAGELQYLVANIRSTDGRSLARQHRVGHVTLLLFDGKGNRREILAGPNSSDFLLGAFQRHVARSAPN